MIEIDIRDTKIRLHSDPCLAVPSTFIVDFGKQTRLYEYGERLKEAVIESGGLAVAAPQLDIPVAMFAYKLPDDKLPRLACNPKIVSGSHFQWSYREGCLSFPGLFWWINRPKHVLMRYQDLDGYDHSIEASDLKGRVLQHECDHLAGRLILSRLSLSERKKAQRQLNGGK